MRFRPIGLPGRAEVAGCAHRSPATAIIKLWRVSDSLEPLQYLHANVVEAYL